MAASSPRIFVVDDERFDGHRARGRHPERPERLDAARDGLRAAVPAERVESVSAEWLDSADAEGVHPEGHLRRLLEALDGRAGHLDPDTYFVEQTREAAFRAAGGAAALSRALMAGRDRLGLALLRPPGHHARPEAPMGFCVLNNVAIAASAALRAGAERVAIVDWDVHHGNGTQEAFWRDDRVLFVSLHQWPFYPGSGRPDEIGAGAGAGCTANVAMPAGAGPEIYGEAFRTVVLPMVEAHRPDLVLVSAGFDAHARDPLAELELDTDTFAAMASALLRLAGQLGHGRLGFVLEGGYDLIALEASVAALGRAMLGERTELPRDAPRPLERERLAATRRCLGLPDEAPG